MIARAALLVVPALAFAACSGSSSGTPPNGDDGGAGADGRGDDGGTTNEGGGDDGGGGTIDQACGALGAAICGRLQTCDPFGLAITFGDESTCATRWAAACKLGASGKGSTATATQVTACSQAVAAESCDDALDNAQPAACNVAGTLPNGGACASDWQCQSTHCEVAAGGVCGNCAARLGAGSACATADDCNAGLICYQYACVQPGAAGDACSASQPCRWTLGCSSGSGKCQTAGSAGQACQGLGDCDLTHGFYCNAGTHKCAAAQVAKAGDPCGVVSGNFTACGYGGVCINSKCVAPASDGAACDATNGPPCLRLAECVGGKCAAPDPSTCK